MMNDHILEVRDDRGCFREIVFFHYLTSPLGGLYKKKTGNDVYSKVNRIQVSAHGKASFLCVKTRGL